MRVLILITKSNWGGAQRYVYDIATNLPKTLYDVEVMAGGNGPLIERLVEAGIQADGSLPIGRDVNITEDIKAFFKLLSILKEKKPDVLHINSSKIGGLGALAGRMVGIKKIIFTTHGWAFNENRTFISKLLIKISYWVIIFLSHTTIAVSETTKNQIENWPYVYKKIQVIHNGIRPEPGFSRLNARSELAKMNSQFAEILKNRKNAILIGSVGELHRIKGYEYALQAIQEMRQYYPEKKLLYTIFSTGEEKENLEKMITELKIDDSVILFGYVENAYQYLKAFDIFLLPSLSEGLPYIALEAGLAKLPTIATTVGGIPEIIDDMKSGILIQPKNTKEIAYALEFLLSHKKVQKEYAEAFHKKVLEKFSIADMLEKTMGVYEQDRDSSPL